MVESTVVLVHCPVKGVNAAKRNKIVDKLWNKNIGPASTIHPQ